MNQKLAWVLFAFAFVVAVVVGFGGKADLRPAPEEFRAKFHETVLKPRPKAIPSAVETPTGRSPSSAGHGDRRPAGGSDPVDAVEPLTPELFARAYGEKLAFRSHAGRVIRVDGSGLTEDAYAPDQKIGGFRPSNAAEVSARAREIFARARTMLGVPDDAEFVIHPPTTGDSTAQVIIQQSDKGIPISPGGLVTILLGPDGEVRAIDSSIYPKTEVTNAAVLPPPGSSRQILFVTQSAPTAVLRHAYETRDRGIQKIVDAQTGEILLERNRRIH